MKCLKCHPNSSRLDIGSIQHLMTLQRYTDTVLTSQYSNIHVSIPPDPDFGTLTKCNGWHVHRVYVVCKFVKGCQTLVMDPTVLESN